MKIGFLLPSIRKGGPQSVVLALVEQFVAQGIDVKVFYFDDKLGTNYPCHSEKIKFTNYKKIVDLDILHTHGIRPDLFVFLFKQFFKAKTISTLHSYIEKEYATEKGKLYSKLVWFIWNVFLLRHNAIICLTQHMKLYYTNKAFNKKLYYCYNSVKNSINTYQDIDNKIHLKLETARKKYVIIGNISFILKRKGLTQIIDLLTVNTALFAVFVGDGEFKNELESYSLEKKVNDRCLFLGHQQNPKLFIPFFDVYLMPSYAEGFPMAVLEVGLFGKPVVCSNLEIYNELFTQEQLVTFQVNNISDFSAKVDYAIKNASQLGLNLKQKINDFYTSKSAAENHLRIYNTILHES